MKPLFLTTAESRALLAGATMIVRPVRDQHHQDCLSGLDWVGPEIYQQSIEDKHGFIVPGPPVYGIYSKDGEWGMKCPYRPGDVVPGKESWAPTPGGQETEDNGAIYRTDSADRWLWRSSATMPLWAVRHWLKIEAVRCKRLQDDTSREAKIMCVLELLYPELQGANPWCWFYTVKRVERPLLTTKPASATVA